MPPWRGLPSLGSKVVDGVVTLGLKGGGSAGIGQVAPARFLPGLWRPPRQGPWWGSSHRPSTLRVSGLVLLGGLVASLPSSAPLGVAVGAAPTARAQVKGYKIGPLLLCTDTNLSHKVSLSFL